MKKKIRSLCGEGYVLSVYIPTQYFLERDKKEDVPTLCSYILTYTDSCEIICAVYMIESKVFL